MADTSTAMAEIRKQMLEPEFNRSNHLWLETLALECATLALALLLLSGVFLTAVYCSIDQCGIEATEGKKESTND